MLGYEVSLPQSAVSLVDNEAFQNEDKARVSADMLPANIFVEQLGGYVAGSDTNWIVVAGYYTVVISDVPVSMSLASGLVSPKTASALSMAMLSSEQPFEIGIPEWRISFEQDIEDLEVELSKVEQYESDIDGSKGIAVESFEFTPWIADFYTERYMHNMDPHWPTLSRTWLTVSLDFVNRLKLLREPGRLLYKNHLGEPVVVPQSWIEGSYTPRYDNRTTYGHRLNIRRSDLETYMGQVGKDLLVRVVISRNRRNPSSSEEYDYGQSTIFIVCQSGKIEVLGRSS